MKAILLSIKPEWLAKILNGEKTIEVRKKFPKDYVGWVYLYCSKGNKELYKWSEKVGYFPDNHCKKLHHQPCTPNALNGKVVARFWCDKVDKYPYITDRYDELIGSCLSEKELLDYSTIKIENGIRFVKTIYAIHISKLEIFDRPRELSEFKRYHEASEHSACWKCKRFGTGCVSCSLTKAPQNYCYIEV